MFRSSAVQTLTRTPVDSLISRRSPRILRSFAAAMFALLMVSIAAPAPSAAATGSAPKSTFECFVNASGQRIVRAHLPQAYSSYAEEQVWLLAGVYKKNSAGTFDLVGWTFNGDYMTGIATPSGLAPIIPRVNWMNDRTGAFPSHGGQLIVGRGTYRVVSYFWWEYGSRNWVGANATVWGTTALGCTFS